MTTSPEARTPVINADNCENAGDVMAFVSRRWTSAILYAGTRGAHRFGDYRRMVAGISDRMLTVRLKELEARELIRREVVPSMPVQVLYHLTERGRSLIAAVHAVASWAAHEREQAAETS